MAFPGHAGRFWPLLRWRSVARIAERASNDHLMTAPVADPEKSGNGKSRSVYRFLRNIPTWVLWLIVLVWCVPTLGLLVNSFRSRDEQRSSGWWSVLTGNFDGFTFDNYSEVLSAEAQGGMKQALANSLAIALPATIIPIAIAAFAAYAFAWIDFKGRQPLFIVTVSLLAIPTQVALDPAVADVRRAVPTSRSRGWTRR